MMVSVLLLEISSVKVLRPSGIPSRLGLSSWFVLDVAQDVAVLDGRGQQRLVAVAGDAGQKLAEEFRLGLGGGLVFLQEGEVVLGLGALLGVVGPQPSRPRSLDATAQNMLTAEVRKAERMPAMSRGTLSLMFSVSNFHRARMMPVKVLRMPSETNTLPHWPGGTLLRAIWTRAQSIASSTAMVTASASVVMPKRSGCRP